MSQHNDIDHEKIRTRKHATRKLLAAALALALGTVGGGAQAAFQHVTNCNDHGSGSMRAAITAAMNGDVVDATGLTCSTISLSTGALAVTANSLTVKGAGPGRLTVTNGAKYGRVFRHEGIGRLTLRGMTITSGVVSAAAIESGTRGGCIYSNGAVTLGDYFDPTDAASGVVVSDCTAVSTSASVPAEGGGIFAAQGVELSHSKVTNGRAIAQDQAIRAFGGGIAARAGSGDASFTMKYSEVADCEVSGTIANGGGINAYGMHTVTISHSTIAANSASSAEGGAYLVSFAGHSSVTIDDSTISGNTASYAGGLTASVISSSGSGAIKVYSSTITGNQSTGVNASHAAASFSGSTSINSTIAVGNFRSGVEDNLDIFANTTGANNLVGSVTDKPPQSGWIVVADAKLGPLMNRGGFTRVHLPLSNSPAINAGNNTFGSNTDQRGPGFPRVIGVAPDIGAAEFDPDRIFNNGFD